MNAPANERARAARHLVRVLVDGKTTDQTFGIDPKQQPSPLCQELVYGTLRYYFSLNKAVEQRLSKSLRSKDMDLRLLMLVGAYQLRHTRIPAHAAINETVNACRPLRKPWAKALINAVLRSISSDADHTDNELTERSFELPEWISTRLLNRYPDNARETMSALLERAPMSLRINTRQSSPEAYKAMLDQADIAWNPGLHDEHVVLAEPRPAGDLPGYARGLVSIQDGGAQLAAGILSPPEDNAADRPGVAKPHRILDACAAPGGKLFHLAEKQPDADMCALEINPARLEYLVSEAARLGHQGINFLAADATGLEWWDTQLFDQVLLDAPCSGVGTLRRHPDIKHLRSADDLAIYQKLQGSLLRNLWRTLAPGGNLLYCTCSLFQEENDTVVEQFLSETADASSQKLQLAIGQATASGWQVLPGTSAEQSQATSVDGFYYAVLYKSENGMHG